MKKIFTWTIVGLLAAGVAVVANGPDAEGEEAAIRSTALDYIEGWFEGNAERMDRALHPQLAKRAIAVNAKTGQERFVHLVKDQMVKFTEQGGGKKTPLEKRGIKVTILDTYGRMASVRIDSVDFIDYLHIAKWKGEWKIINVFWENRPKPE